MATKLTPFFILWQSGLKWAVEQNQLVYMTRNENSNEKVLRPVLINCIIMQCQSWIKCTDFVHYLTGCFTSIIKCRIRTNVFRKGNWKQLPMYLGKEYIADLFVQNEEQFKICRAFKIIKREQSFPSLQGAVSGVKLVMSPGFLVYFRLTSAFSWHSGKNP